jgi:uncharacterized protein YrrD
MLLSFRDLRRFEVRATDAEAGAVTDVLFDDRDWTIRYFVVDSGGLLKSHPVLIGPELVERVVSEERLLALAVDREHIAESPPVQSHPPVSRRREDAMRAYFGLAPLHFPHGVPVDVWGQPTDEDPTDVVERELHELEEQHADPHLRSSRAWLGYGVEGDGAHLGVVDDLLFGHGDGWRFDYLVVDTGRWLAGKRRLVATDWIGAVSHDARFVRVNLSRERMAQAPDFETAEDVDHGAERWLFRHYGFSPRR